jgi:diguanylate cyclase (GGDEF)-like protein/PAS domain S-box-containing protein
MESGGIASAKVSMRKDAFGGILACDETIKEALGWEPGDLVGKRSLDFINSDDHDSTVALWMELLEHPNSVQVVRYRHRHADGSWFQVEVCSRNLLEEEGFVECTLVVLGRADGEAASVGSGASELKAIRFLRSGERLLRRLADGLPTGVAYITSDGVVDYVNLQCRLLLDARSGMHMNDLFRRFDDEDAETAQNHLQRMMGSDEELLLTVTTASSHGPIQTLELDLRGLAEETEGPAGIVLSVDDITDRITATTELERRATTDPLTGCLNRSATFEVLRQALRGDDQLVVVFADVDRMKAQNDLLGHAGGDALLVATAARLQEAVRPGDIVGRIGGDEFVAVCHGVPTREAAQMVASRIAESVHWIFDFGSVSFPVSASVGAVQVDRTIEPAEAVARADVAMYAAKRSAHGDAVLWDHSLIGSFDAYGEDEALASELG